MTNLIKTIQLIQQESMKKGYTNMYQQTNVCLKNCFKTPQVTYQTKDYSIFKKVDGNRLINQANVNSIVKNIQTYGLKPTVLIVNEKMEVIDGQHRLEAFKKLGVPVNFQIHQGLTIKDCIALNISGKKWNRKDYIYSYAEQGAESYVKLVDFIERHPNISPMDIAGLAKGTVGFASGSSRSMEKGDFDFIRTPDELEKILVFIDNVTALNLKIHGKKYLVSYILGNLYAEGYIDPERMIEQLQRYGKELTLADTKTALEEIEYLYNYRRRNTVRFKDKFYETFIDCKFGNGEGKENAIGKNKKQN